MIPYLDPLSPAYLLRQEQIELLPASDRRCDETPGRLLRGFQVEIKQDEDQ